MSKPQVLRSPSFPFAHGFTTRIGGVSLPPYDSMNMGFNRPEPRTAVLENYHRLADSCGFDFSSMILVSYEHGANVVKVDSTDALRGIDNALPPLPPCDGLVTNDQRVTLVTLHADCAAVYVCATDVNAVGIAHAGYKGTFAGVGRNLVSMLKSSYMASPEAMRAIISPCICGNCYEVDCSLALEFAAEYGESVYSLSAIQGKAYLNLRAVLHIQLERAGIPAASITDIDYCTYENAALLYSYRRDGKAAGAMAGFIAARHNLD